MEILLITELPNVVNIKNNNGHIIYDFLTNTNLYESSTTSYLLTDADDLNDFVKRIYNLCNAPNIKLSKLDTYKSIQVLNKIYSMILKDVYASKSEYDDFIKYWQVSYQMTVADSIMTNILIV